MEMINVKASDGLILSCIYSKAEKPKGMIQIIHGMIEHKERYEGFIEFLNQNGFTVIISDLRGHGKSINDEYKLGHIGTIEQMVDDQMAVTNFIKKKNPNLPLYLFGHSMGSLIARMYIEEHDDEIKKLILSGTVGYNPGSKLGARIGKKKMKKNKYMKSKLLFAFTNNLSFKDKLNWLSYSKENIENYKADPLCGFHFDVSGYYTLFESVKNLTKTDMYECKNKDLKILSISGIDDRTTLHTKGLKKVLGYLNTAGYKNTSFIEYPHMKHEILMEEEKDKVLKDILQFFE
jgi:alpha-beta hydrolase superfamily lysophospholipase